MSKPSHIAYVVTKDAGREDFWRPVGAVFQHSKGNGFDLIIHERISVSGRIVCTERKDKPAAETADVTQ
jgi:hypothetical protein